MATDPAMETLTNLFTGDKPLGPWILGTLAIAALLLGARFLLEKRYKGVPEGRFRVQLIMLGLSLAALLGAVVLLPVSDELRGQLLSLIGILLSAAIALSSTTFVGNAMAGVLLRVVGGFKLGDFLQVGDHFGRASERGLFHTEIQTEDRDLTTLPNLYLVTHPMTVVRASGTIISATVSLGYDRERSRIEKLLLAAAEAAELEEPFVQILELGDFSVSYRVAGLLTEVKHLISARSRLRSCVIDSLHGGGVEIVSPTFMNTRAVPEGKTFIPAAEEAEPEAESAKAPEEVVFDKADQAESRERVAEEHGGLGAREKQLRERLKEAGDGAEKERLERELESLAEERERLAAELEKKEEEAAKE